MKKSKFKVALEEALTVDNISFHVPGHKSGTAQKIMGYENAAHLKWDTTEIEGTDNLHYPEGMIQEAQQRAANFYKSKETFFLVNGTTGGILAMMLTALNPGETVIVGRDCHQSVLHGAYLARATVKWMAPQYDSKTRLNLSYSVNEIERVLKQYPEAKALVLTNPTYFGICSNLKAIAQQCRQNGVLLMVDEAHGAHLLLANALPVSALEAGADLTVQSTHKSLSAMTQSSMLHVGSEAVDIERLRWMLRIVQSSSPSYVLMESLDQAVEMAAEQGNEYMEALLKNIESFQNRMEKVPGINCVTAEQVKTAGAYDFDPTKIILSAVDLGLDGAELSEKLSAHGIQMELSTPWHSLGVTTIGNSREDIVVLGDVLESVARDATGEKTDILEGLEIPELPEVAYDWLVGQGLQKESCLLEESLGRIAADMIVPYPPGIPILVPGERMGEDQYQYLMACKKLGISVMGLDPKTNAIRVVSE